MSKTSQAHTHTVAEKRFFAIVTTLVFSLGLFAFMSVVREPPMKVVSVISDSGGGYVGSSSRAPASVNDGVTAETPMILDFDCETPVKTKEITTSFLRLKGARCSEAKDLQIVNQSNGFTASLIFTNQKKEFTTDFIDLIDGSNRLQVSWLDSRGQKSVVDLIVNKKNRLAETPDSL